MKRRDFLSGELARLANEDKVPDHVRIGLLALVDVVAGLVTKVKNLEEEIKNAESDPGQFVSKALERFIRLEKTWMAKNKSLAVLSSRRDMQMRADLRARLVNYKFEQAWKRYVQKEYSVRGN